jgi:hypothetical protein
MRMAIYIYNEIRIKGLRAGSFAEMIYAKGSLCDHYLSTSNRLPFHV